MKTSIQVTRNKIIRVSYAICSTNPLIYLEERRKKRGEAKERVRRGSAPAASSEVWRKSSPGQLHGNQFGGQSDGDNLKDRTIHDKWGVGNATIRRAADIAHRIRAGTLNK